MGWGRVRKGIVLRLGLEARPGLRTGSGVTQSTSKANQCLDPVADLVCLRARGKENGKGTSCMQAGTSMQKSTERAHLSTLGTVMRALSLQTRGSDRTPSTK